MLCPVVAIPIAYAISLPDLLRTTATPRWPAATFLS